ncbi:nitrate- and nitrite sensing domain-containing protein [Actinophytocola sp.]|uniref:sensor histidine kinase n=1 Tax=Actinophytocola sp. TaxID=1872138 RepID=UPI002ED2E4C7
MPSLVFLIAGVLGAGYLIFDAAKTRNYYQTASTAQDQALPLIVSLQEERRLTLRRLASYGTYTSDLIKQRQITDAVTGKATSSLGELAEIAPDQVKKAVSEFGALMRQLPEMRARVDGGQVAISEAASLYNGIIDQFVAGAKGLAQSAPDAEIAYRQMVLSPLLGSIDLMHRSDALAAAALVGGGLTNADFTVYQGQVAAYHLQLAETIPLTDPAVQAMYRKLTGSPAWLRLNSVEETLVRGDSELPISEDLWRGASSDVSKTLMGMLSIQNDRTNALALSKVDGTLIESIIGGIVVLALVSFVFVFALRLSRRLIERLVRLRTETLELAEKRLPSLVERVRTGADVNVDEAQLGDYGGDEIGEVAIAFNKAQQTAVTSAVQEAKTREGTNKVFLNIAHRSQVIVHRQLKTLDEAERKQEDPEQLELLFQLDHLTTRQRRNAENLIILGGGQPGRRWRNPVSLAEVVRGSAAETEDFARVKAAKLPPRKVIGPVVGDLVHLLAELIDNAATFSPPGSRVEVRGNVVGRGVVLEIEDQGLGIEADRIDDLNNMLVNPPDFGIMALSTEPRLGLFVVARLAARHGIGVTLRESAYGGTRAIVLVRNELLGPDTDDLSAPDSKQDTPEQPVERVNGNGNGAPGPRSAIKLSIPGAVSLPDLPPLPVVEPRPGEDLFRPQRPVDAEHEPSQPVRRPPQQPKEPPRSTEPPRQVEPQQRSGEQPPELPKRTPAPPRAPERSAEPVQAGGPDLAAPAPPSADTRQPSAQQPPQAPQFAQAPGRPALPQRRRQQNLAPQLREDPAPTWPQSSDSPEVNREDSPEQARSRLAAFQSGTRRGRHAQASDETVKFDDSVGSGRNGQHRSE